MDLTAALIMDFLAVDENRQMVAEVLWPAFFDQQRPQMLAETKYNAKTRWLLNGSDITNNQAGTQVAARGESYADRVNIVGGSAYWSNKPESRQLNLSLGAGSDCLFDYLVSSCFSSLSGFTEGQTFTSLSGCTFKGYSTIQGALTAAGALSANDSSTIAICSGTYAETLTRTDVNNASLTLLGTGQGNVIVKPTSGSIILTLPTQANTNDAVIISGITFDTASMSAGSTAISCGGSQRIKINNCQINVQSATDIGIVPGTSAGVAVSCSQVNFTGAGIGIQTAVSGLPGFIVNNCSFEQGAIGVHVRGQVAVVIGSFFATTIGVQCSGSGAVQALTVTGNTFEGCTTGIKHTATGTPTSDYGQSIGANTFIACTTAIDFSTLAGNASSFSVTGNSFVKSTGTTGIKLHATRVLHSVISGNTFAEYVAGNEISGMTQAQMITADTQVCHNATDSGTPITEYGIGHAGSGTGGAAPNSEAFVTIGNSANLSAERALTAGSNISITDNGANSTVVVAATGLAVTTEPYVTIGNTAGLSAERALTAGTGITISDGGANSTVTIALTTTPNAARELTWFSQTPVAGDQLAYQMIRFNGAGATAISPMQVSAKDYGYGTTRINLLRAPNAHTVSATGGLPNPVFTTILNTDLNIESSHMTFTGMEDVTISGGAVSGTALAFDDIVRADYDAVNNAVDMLAMLTITVP